MQHQMRTSKECMLCSMSSGVVLVWCNNVLHVLRLYASAGEGEMRHAC
jgi:hypothetical protein